VRQIPGWQARDKIVLDPDVASSPKIILKGSGMGKLYKVHEFAEVAGVTVRTLHHYDKLGLLEPRRTAAGYRVYTLRDLERLEQIVALKFLGLPLKQVQHLLDRKDALQLPEALRMQRGVLEEKRRLLERAISAIEDAEKVLESGKPADAALLKKIIEVIEMQNGAEVMKKYFSEEAWAKWKQRHAPWPSEKWLELFRDVETALGKKEDPSGKKAQALAERWVRLRLEDTGGDVEIQIGLLKAWIDRQNWPAAVREKVSEFDLERIAEFVSKAVQSYKKKYYSEDAWVRLMQQSPASREQNSVAWLELLLEVGAALGEDPGGEKAQALAARWMELWQTSTGGDPGIQAGSIKAWADQQNWPPAMQKHKASFNFENLSDFIHEALDCYRKKYYSEQAWAKLEERRRQSTPEERGQLRREWVKLFCEVEAALGEDPTGENAQALAARWRELSDRATGGDPEIREGTVKAWEDRQNWPAWKQQRSGPYQYEKIGEFIGKAMAGPIVKYFSDEAWKKMAALRKQSTKESRERASKVRTELFRDLVAALGQDPGGKKAQALATRWNAMSESDSGGHADVKAGWEKYWADHRNWPDKSRHEMASHLNMSPETLDRMADFLEKILASHKAHGKTHS
jgi:DNA-binding transcriptional MerR regulator